MDFGEFRRKDFSIDLTSAWEDTHRDRLFLIPVDLKLKAIGYLKRVEAYHPVRSRQAAALALSQADIMVMSEL